MQFSGIEACYLQLSPVKKDKNGSYFTVIFGGYFTVIFTAYLLVFDCAILIVSCIKVGIHRWRLEPGNKYSGPGRDYLLLKLDFTY